MSACLSKSIEELIREDITIVPYNPVWHSLFREEESFLRKKLGEFIGRIEHFGSTSVPGLAAKPIIDILVELKDSRDKDRIVGILEGYDYYWRPIIGDSGPSYAWFIKRDAERRRSHHIHMVEADSELWDRLFFRDYLRSHADEARRYEQLKRQISGRHPGDRAAYTKEKTEYIVGITGRAKALSQGNRKDPP